MWRAEEDNACNVVENVAVVVGVEMCRNERLEQGVRYFSFEDLSGKASRGHLHA